MKRNISSWQWAVVLLLCGLGAARAQVVPVVIHNLNATGTFDGQQPYGNVAVSADGNSIYGMTYYGGHGQGTIYSCAPDGSGYHLIHEFSAGASSTNGSGPIGNSVTLVGSTLYGMTTIGGSQDLGAIFRVQTDGTGFSLLDSFNMDDNNGMSPVGDLTYSAGNLYGMTPQSGITGRGNVFSMSTNGTGFTILHNWSLSPTNGALPLQPYTQISHNDVLVSGSNLYGMTYYNGVNGDGTIWSMNTNGSGFSLLHLFNNSDGYWSAGSLTLAAGRLYGMTIKEGGQTITERFFPSASMAAAIQICIRSTPTLVIPLVR